MEHYQKYLEEGYSEEQAFYLAEIKTTQQMLTDLGNKGVYMPTLLINSLLSMIVLPYEKAQNNNAFKEKFSLFEKQMNITPTLFIPIENCKNYEVHYKKVTTKNFVNKLRNGVAHQNIKVSIINDKDFTITIKNKYHCNNCNKCPTPVCKDKGVKREKSGVIDFEITLTVKQLTQLANYIANAYIKALSKENNNG